MYLAKPEFTVRPLLVASVLLVVRLVPTVATGFYKRNLVKLVMTEIMIAETFVRLSALLSQLGQAAEVRQAAEVHAGDATASWATRF
jgi:hypothetical protein